MRPNDARGTYHRRTARISHYDFFILRHRGLNIELIIRFYRSLHLARLDRNLDLLFPTLPTRLPLEFAGPTAYVCKFCINVTGT